MVPAVDSTGAAWRVWVVSHPFQPPMHAIWSWRTAKRRALGPFKSNERQEGIGGARRPECQAHRRTLALAQPPRRRGFSSSDGFGKEGRVADPTTERAACARFRDYQAIQGARKCLRKIVAKRLLRPAARVSRVMPAVGNPVLLSLLPLPFFFVSLPHPRPTLFCIPCQQEFRLLGGPSTPVACFSCLSKRLNIESCRSLHLHQPTLSRPPLFCLRPHLFRIRYWSSRRLVDTREYWSLAHGSVHSSLATDSNPLDLRLAQHVWQFQTIGRRRPLAGGGR